MPVPVTVAQACAALVAAVPVGRNVARGINWYVTYFTEDSNLCFCRFEACTERYSRKTSRAKWENHLCRDHGVYEADHKAAMLHISKPKGMKGPSHEHPACEPKLVQKRIDNFVTPRRDISKLTAAVHKAMLNYLTSHSLPLAAMSGDSKTFVALVNALSDFTRETSDQSAFTPPTALSLKNRLIVDECESLRQKIKQDLAFAMSQGAYPSITADGWQVCATF
jgi:hypothetical protein